jgi:NTE family protein
MRYVFVWLLIFTLVMANEVIHSDDSQSHQKRPRIGLVLGGGGTKGAAHVGLIRFLEEKNIPIDAVAGTSVGSLIGGLYASGMSIDEIEKMMLSADWRDMIAFENDRKAIPFRKKKLEREFASNIKAGVDEDDEIVLASGLFKRQNMMQFLRKKLRHVDDNISFDTLNIPFRCVATELRTGDKVVLSKGSLSESIYASLAIPGGFEPIVIEGKTLVDGGLADNLPVDVMREMNVDIIIVSNIGEPESDKTAYKSYLEVMTQLSDLLTRKNIQYTLENLKDNEILISPDMSNYSFLELDKFQEVMDVGYTAAKEAYDDGRITALGLDKESYLAYKKSFRTPEVKRLLVRDVRIVNRTYISDKTIRSQLNIPIGEPLDYDQLTEDIRDIYNLQVFEEVNYEITQIDDGIIVTIKATPKWDINGQLRFGFGFEDDFKGHSDYTVQFEYIMFGLTSYGGEWRNYFRVGREKLAMTELFLPLDARQIFYVRPWLFYRDNKVYISPTLLADHSIRAELDESLPIHAVDHGVAGALGVNLGRSVQLEAGVIKKEVKPEINLLTVGPFSSSFVTLEARQNVVKSFVRLEIDTLNQAYFPSRGFLLSTGFEEQMPQWGSENDYQQFDVNALAAFGNEVHTVLLHGKYGTTYNDENFEQSQDFNDYYTLGGLFNLSGLPTNALTGDNMAFGSLNYRYRLSDNDFFGELSTPVYVGGTAEVGRAWYQYLNLDLPQEDTFTAGSLYMGADTILGPFYLGAGYTEGGYYNFYLNLGQRF